MATYGDTPGSRKTSNRFSIASLPSLLTKTPKGPETPSAKSATIVSASTASDNLGLGNKPNSVKSHDSVKSNKPARIKRKQPGSNLGSVSSIATKASGNLTPPFTDGQLEDGDLDNRKGTHDVLYHGHVQTNMGLFFKKKEYVVLTETHLLRFKDFSQAAKSFPHMNREQHSKPQRHGSTPSFGSMYDLQTSSSKSSNEAESKNSIPLHHIVATYRADDGRPFFIVQIDYMDDTTIFAATSSAMQLMLQDPREADIWHSSIRAASMRAKLVIVQPIPQKTIGNITSILEAAMDHDSSRMEIFFAVHLGKQAAGKSSAEDVAAVATPLCYLVLGATKLHLISVPDVQDLGKQKQYKAHKTSYGIVSLVAIDFKENDNDAFDLHFRLPMQPKVILKLASCQAIPIATSLFKSIVHLKPQWLDYTFMYSGPPEVIEDPGLDLQEVLRDDTGCFDRTLIAYCQAYGCAAHNIRYEIRDDVEDYPQFALLPPQESRAYSMHELLAIFRSLRYNNTFQSLSFADVSLESLDGVFDTYGDEHVASSSRGNTKVKCQVNTQGTSLLHQEVQGIALKSYRLKRIDFSNTLPQRKLVTSYDDQSPSRGPTCALVSAIFPICGAVKFTQIDWIVLNGVDLSRADLEVMGPTLREAGANLRAVEIARCGFDETELGTFLTALRHQAGSVECINIANNIGRLAPGKIGELLQVFTRIRILNLCRAATSVGTDPVIDLEVLITWKLEQILLNGVAINRGTLDAIAGYLSCNNSSGLSLLQLESCGLTGSDVACLMRTMVPQPGIARNLTLNVSSNNFEVGMDKVARAVKENRTPVHLVMRMVEYTTESRFRQLLEALRHNTTIKIIDISKASLPSDAGDATCLALQKLFEDNNHLEELDISGEKAHLETARFGIGLNHALTGLKNNQALRVLKIEYQELGVEGANALASVILSNNTLTHIYCENNGISLQSFTILISCLEKNHNIVFLPLMEADKEECLKQMYVKLTESRSVVNTESKTKHAFRKTSGLLKVNHKQAPSVPTPQDISHAIDQMTKRWQTQRARLIEFTQRNLAIAQEGREAAQLLQDEKDYEELMRPNTADSESYIMEVAMNTTTPRFERNNPHDSNSSGTRNMKEPRMSTSDHDEGDVSPSTEKKDSLGMHTRGRSGSELAERMGKFEIGPE